MKPESPSTSPFHETREMRRLNVGARTRYLDLDGREWASDDLPGAGRLVEHDPAIRVASPHRPDLYRSSRAGLDEVRLPVADGPYTVLLHLAEMDRKITGPAQRVFTVQVGDRELRDVDPYQAAGGHGVPLVYSFPVVVHGGELPIRFIPTVGEAILSGLEIVPDVGLSGPAQGGIEIVGPATWAGVDDPYATVTSDYPWDPPKLALVPGLGAGDADLEWTYVLDTNRLFGDYRNIIVEREVEIEGCDGIELLIRSDGSDRHCFVEIQNPSGAYRAWFRLGEAGWRKVTLPLSAFGRHPLWWQRPSDSHLQPGPISSVSLFVQVTGGSALGGGTIVLHSIRGIAGVPAVGGGILAAVPSADPLIDAFEGEDSDLWERYGWIPHGGLPTFQIERGRGAHGSSCLRLDYTHGAKGTSGLFQFFQRDWSKYNTFRFWLEPDGSEHELRIHFTADIVCPVPFGIPLNGAARYVDIRFDEFFGHLATVERVTEIAFQVRRKGPNTSGGTIYLDDLHVFADPALPLGLKKPEPPVEALMGGGPWRINVGGSDELVDAMGRSWMADRGAVWGVEAQVPDAVVSGTEVPEIFRSARTLARGYRFRVPNGKYEVRVHAAETFGLYAAGQRAWSMTLNGATLGEMDPVRDGGGPNRAVVRTGRVEVRDGLLQLEIKDLTRMSSVLQGLEVIPTDWP
jgi:hypothetical protein